MNRYDILAVGEVLIDFTPCGINDQGMQLFARNPGGAPANVLAMNAKLGGSSAFVGKVGNDTFGKFLYSILKKSNIDISGLIIDEYIPTTLAFVQLDENGDRTFSFYRKPGADLMLQVSDIKETLVVDCHIFHFGSVSLTDEPARSATMFAAKTAKKAGCIISYDPNYRPLLWSNVETAIGEMMAGLSLADIVKVSEDEMLLFTGKTDLQEGSYELSSYGASLVLITLGSKGAFYRKGEMSGFLPAYDVKTIVERPLLLVVAVGSLK